MASVLIVEDEASLRTTMRIALNRAGYQTETAECCAAARQALDHRIFDLCIVDLRLPDGDGLELLSWIADRGLDLATVVVSAYGSVETAVEAMRLGAHDFVQKPFAAEELIASAARALEHLRLRAELQRRGGPLLDPRAELVGDSDAIARVRELIPRAAEARVVLVTGETGTGKDLVARAIHATRSPQAPFVIIDCGSLPELVVESELFGHVPGAFPGAERARRGLIGEADGGTAFFNEVGEVPLNMQMRLLRFLESSEVRAVGSDRARRVDCSVIAATHRDLAADVAAERFRQDLLYRLDVFRIALPPLRERLEDLPALCERLLGRIARGLRREIPELDSDAIEALRDHAWPGNVRELEHALERAMLLTQGEPLPADLLVDAMEFRGDGPDDAIRSLAEVEQEHIMKVLEECGGDRSRAARMLGIARSTLRRKLMSYDAQLSPGSK